MKKTLLFALLAISLDAFAQNFPSESTRQHPMSNSVQNVLNEMVKGGKKTTGITSEKYWGKSTLNQRKELFLLFAQYDSVYNWVWDPLSIGWTIDSKTIHLTYDAKNNLTGFVDQIWNGSTWINNLQYTAIFDANNDQISYTDQEWDGNAWENSEQFTSTYDTHHNKTTFTFKIWNGSAWENVSQVTYTYDANNNQTSQFYKSWDGSTWENVAKQIYTYDANHNLTIEVDQYWDGSAWENDGRYTYTYNTNNNRISGLEQYWNGSSWENSDQYTYTYDPNNNLLVWLDQFWNGSGWENSDRYNYAYDSNNNLISELDQTWNGSSWVKSSQSLYTYDADNFETSESYRYFDDNGLMVVYGDSSYLYFHTVTGTHDLTTEDGLFNVYPNPTSGKFTLSSNSTLSAIEIYNLLGERIYADHFNQQTSGEIDLSAQGKGIYLINMYDGTQMFNRKIVVQ